MIILIFSTLPYLQYLLKLLLLINVTLYLFLFMVFNNKLYIQTLMFYDISFIIKVALLR